MVPAGSPAAAVPKGLECQAKDGRVVGSQRRPPRAGGSVEAAARSKPGRRRGRSPPGQGDKLIKRTCHAGLSPPRAALRGRAGLGRGPAEAGAPAEAAPLPPRVPSPPGAVFQVIKAVRAGAQLLPRPPRLRPGQVQLNPRVRGH